MINGVITRTEKAAIINYNDNETVNDEIFVVDGMTDHRKEYFENGNIKATRWYKPYKVL